MQDILTKALEEQDTLCHYGVLGMHWGVRRYQNPDGSLTELGRKRFLKPNSSSFKKYSKAQRENFDARQAYNKVAEKYEKTIRNKKPTAAEIRKAGIEVMNLMDEYKNDYDHNDPKAVNSFYDKVFERRFDDSYIFPEYKSDAMPVDKFMKKNYPELVKNVKKTDKKVDKAVNEAYTRAKMTGLLTGGLNYQEKYKSLVDKWSFRDEMFDEYLRETYG